MRIASAFAENSLLYFVVLGSAIFLFPAAGPFGGRDDTPEAATDSTYHSAYLVTCWWVYYAFQERSPLRSTFVKKLNGLIVTDLKGNRIGIIRATVRHVARLITMLTFLTGYLTILFTKRQQTIHDLISGTVVTRIEESDDIEIAPETETE
ncbi:MAG: RDD family protein [Planctomycetaceae bacterium]|nr:RDD family protein [Planctomycetaceae bacterium]